MLEFPVTDVIRLLFAYPSIEFFMRKAVIAPWQGTVTASILKSRGPDLVNQFESAGELVESRIQGPGSQLFTRTGRTGCP